MEFFTYSSILKNTLSNFLLCRFCKVHSYIPDSSFLFEALTSFSQVLAFCEWRHAYPELGPCVLYLETHWGLDREMLVSCKSPTICLQPPRASTHNSTVAPGTSVFSTVAMVPLFAPPQLLLFLLLWLFFCPSPCPLPEYAELLWGHWLAFESHHLITHWP